MKVKWNFVKDLRAAIRLALLFSCLFLCSQFRLIGTQVDLMFHVYL